VVIPLKKVVLAPQKGGIKPQKGGIKPQKGGIKFMRPLKMLTYLKGQCFNAFNLLNKLKIKNKKSHKI